ncbi:hypothetical protein SUSAZ_05420 [Sulfolobus acidocaldarius SUSAZ]|nr:hypothetical protein SUSAZ_05420 [Sulfolobus acidocaldarius SUSAZ]
MNRKIEFGIFTHVEMTDDQKIYDIVDNELEAIKYAEKLGNFQVYFMAEHWLTPLTVNQPVSLMLALASKYTDRIRFGPLAYIVSHRNPIALANEICLLDNLSKGRLEVGFTSGVSNAELMNLGLDPSKAREDSREITSILISFLKSASEGKPFSFNGKYLTYDKVEPLIKPYQKPYPPIWIPTTNPSTVPWVAENGFNMATVFLTDSEAKALFDRYRETYYNIMNVSTLPDSIKLGISRNVFISSLGDKDKLSRMLETFVKRLMYAAVKKYSISIESLFSSGPAFSGSGFRGIPDLMNAETAIKHGSVLFGDPENIAKKIVEVVRYLNINFFIAHLHFGNMPYEDYLEGLRIFSRDVIPLANKLISES